MRITLKLIVSLIVVVVFVAIVSAYFNVRQEKAKLYEEVLSRSALLAESFKESVRHNLAAKSYASVQRLADKFQSQKQLEGVAVYDSLDNSRFLFCKKIGQFFVEEVIVYYEQKNNEDY